MTGQHLKRICYLKSVKQHIINLNDKNNLNGVFIFSQKKIIRTILCKKGQKKYLYETSITQLSLSVPDQTFVFMAGKYCVSDGGPRVTPSAGRRARGSRAPSLLPEGRGASPLC